MAKTLQDQLRPELALAISKANVGSDYRDGLKPGPLAGTALVRLSWNLKIGPDYEQVINHSIPWDSLFALALSKCNAATVDSLVREYIERDEQGLLPDTETLKSAALGALTRIKGAAGKRACKGKVTGEVVVTPVEMAVDRPSK